MSPEARFELIYRSHAGAVRSYASRRCDAQTADDVTADVFVVAWRRLDEIPRDALPWLLGVARRTLANQRRGRARREALRERVGTELALSAATDPGRSGFDGRVLEALMGLRETDREALLLVGWEGLSPAQAAQVLSMRPNTFAARFSRARRRLAAAISEDCAESRSEPRHTKVEATR